MGIVIRGKRVEHFVCQVVIMARLHVFGGDGIVTYTHQVNSCGKMLYLIQKSHGLLTTTIYVELNELAQSNIADWCRAPLFHQFGDP